MGNVFNQEITLLYFLCALHVYFTKGHFALGMFIIGYAVIDFI